MPNGYDADRHLRVLLGIARFKGWIIEKKQVAKVTASVKMSRKDVDAIVQADLERLAPGATGQLARLGREPSGSDLARIAAGTYADILRLALDSKAGNRAAGLINCSREG